MSNNDSNNFGARKGLKKKIKHKVKIRPKSRVDTFKYKSNDLNFKPSKQIPLKPNLVQRSSAAISYSNSLKSTNDLEPNSELPARDKRGHT